MSRRWFFVRVLALVAVLGVPILGTSYALVANGMADIRTAQQERADLRAFTHVIDLARRLEAVHRDTAEVAITEQRRDMQLVDRVFADGEDAYAQPGFLPGAKLVWQHWQHAWAHIGRPMTLAEVDGMLGRFEGIGDDLDDSLLEVDPNYGEQNLASVLLWQLPRAIVAIRRTADGVSAAPDGRLNLSAIEHIAANRALEHQPLHRVTTDLELAITIEPELAAALHPLLQRARSTAGRFERQVDGVLRAIDRGSGNGAGIELLARRAIDAHLALWREIVLEAERLVARRQAEQEQRSRVIAALSLLAVVLGTLAITLTGRYMARRDRIELASVRLEGEKLRSELARISVERALHLQEAQFRSVFENADLGIVIFELSGAIGRYNAAVRTILGDKMFPFLADQTAQMAAFTVACEPFTCEEMQAYGDGRKQWLACTFSGVYDDDGACQLVILLLRDTTEEKLLQQALMHAANHDALTGIANRATFERELNALAACPGGKYAVVYVDLDRFKPVNDNFGHAAGDHVLVTTAERLRSALSSSDSCARIGGDEFAAIVRGRNDRTTLDSIAARVSESISRPIPFGAHVLSVTASVGLALATGGHETTAELKIAADFALYAVKQAGGNGIRISQPDIAQPAAPR